jgi:hypothetical protein
MTLIKHTGENGIKRHPRLLENSFPCWPYPSISTIEAAIKAAALGKAASSKSNSGLW